MKLSKISCVAPQMWYLQEIQIWRVCWSLFLLNHRVDYALCPGQFFCDTTADTRSLCGSQVSFLLRDAMPKRGISGRPVSISLSHLCCIQTAKDIAKLLSRPDSLIILLFRLQAPVPNSKGNPFSRDVKYPGVRKLRFLTEIAAYLGNGTS